MGEVDDPVEPGPPPRGWPQAPWADSAGRLLEIRGLEVRYRAEGPPALAEVDLAVTSGGRLGLIGPSGAGKTTLLRAVMGLLPSAARVTGSVRVDGLEVIGASEGSLRPWRGAAAGIVFEHPTRALNPTMRVAGHVAESLRAHRRMSRRAMRPAVEELLVRVGLDAGCARRFPSELTEADRRRVLLAGAIAMSPRLLLVDDAVTPLSAEAREDFLGLLAQLQADAHFALVLVSHEISALLTMCDEVAVLCGGRVLEQAPPRVLAEHARVPYTAALVRTGRLPVRREPAAPPPVADRRARSLTGPFGIWRAPIARPAAAPASPPRQSTSGCVHEATCERAIAQCGATQPPLKEYEYGHRWACWNPIPALPATSPGSSIGSTMTRTTAREEPDG